MARITIFFLLGVRRVTSYEAVVHRRRPGREKLGDRRGKARMTVWHIRMPPIVAIMPTVLEKGKPAARRGRKVTGLSGTR